jgi:hypothetical protein
MKLLALKFPCGSEFLSIRPQRMKRAEAGKSRRPPFLLHPSLFLPAGIPNLRPIASEYEAFNLKNDETSL